MLYTFNWQISRKNKTYWLLCFQKQFSSAKIIHVYRWSVEMNIEFYLELPLINFSLKTYCYNRKNVIKHSVKHLYEEWTFWHPSFYIILTSSLGFYLHYLIKGEKWETQPWHIIVCHGIFPCCTRAITLTQFQITFNNGEHSLKTKLCKQLEGVHCI